MAREYLTRPIVVVPPSADNPFTGFYRFHPPRDFIDDLFIRRGTRDIKVRQLLAEAVQMSVRIDKPR